MVDSQREKKSKKSGKPKAPANRPSSSSHHGHSPSTDAAEPSHMPPPPTSRPPGQQPPPKIAIPRLRRDSDGQSVTASTAGDKNRVAHACEPCRHRKTKCSGERPRCKHCEDFKLECEYVDGKRDRARKELSDLADRLDEYEKLLTELSIHADGDTQERIMQTLQRVKTTGISSPQDYYLTNVALKESSFEHDATSPMSPYRPGSRFSNITGETAGLHGEDSVTACVGSIDSLDNISEDFNRDAAAQATGFHGKNSEVTWMQRLRQQTSTDDEEQEQDRGTAIGAQNAPHPLDRNVSLNVASINSSTYHCDDISILITDPQIDPYEAPPKHIADLLFQYYLDTVHPTFPMIGKTTLISQYEEYYIKMRVPGNNWLAILNLIFAIGSKYAHRIRPDWTEDDHNHLIFFTRARMLGFNSNSMFGHADLQRVQVSGLMAFYLMATNQINRSWTVSGIAIRHASALGLNLRNNSRDVTDFSKEIRYRVWWALCFLERQLAVMTGRRMCFSEADCTSPLPLPVDENGIVNNPLFERWFSHGSRRNDSVISTSSSGQSYRPTVSPIEPQSPINQLPPGVRYDKVPPNIGLYFLHHTRLSVFTYQVLNRLYRVGNMHKSWAETQATIDELSFTLERWHAELPPAFDFTKRIRDQQWIRQRKSLGFFYYSTMIITNRPCLRRIDRKVSNQSAKAKEFNQSTAAKCVHAAIDMLNLLPDEPNPIGMYTQCPWWCLVHHLVEAAVVCMLELSFRAEHMPNEADEVFESAEKAVQWLQSMSAGDLAASRAWTMCNDMLRKVSPKVGKSASDMLSAQQGMTDQMQGLQSSKPQVESVGLGTFPLSSGPFLPPMYTTYDQMISQDQILQDAPDASSRTIGHLFPTAIEIEAMSFGDQSVQGYLPDRDHDGSWYPNGET